MNDKNETYVESQSADGTAAAKEAAEHAAAQAKELASDAANAVKALEPSRLYYMIALGIVVVFTLIFAMPSFSVGSKGPVSETQAQAERDSEKFLTSISYSAFRSSIWGKIMWLSAVAGIGIVIWAAMTKPSFGWVPLAEVGCAALATLMLLLLFFVGFPNLPNYSDYTTINVSATLLGYWIPLCAAGFATVVSAKRIVDA